jgi:hypothetical protein
MDKDFYLKTAVAIAGSAADSTQSFSGASQRVVSSALNFDVGRFIDNYNEEKTFITYLSYLVPAPLYLALPRYTRDAYGQNIYLSDGGHQENFATFPLVRRLCENILIVDGEYDPTYQFASYFTLKHQIERETGAAMRLIGKSGEAIESMDPAPPERYVPATRGGTPPEACAFDPAHPVLEGKIGPFPVLNAKGQAELKTINLAYIKLSFDPTDLKQWDSLGETQKAGLYAKYGEGLVTFYLESRMGRCKESDFGIPCEFPQLNTFHQSFSPERFRAYVDLGAFLVKDHLKYDGSKFIFH